jgi:hypothetical protein
MFHALYAQCSLFYILPNEDKEGIKQGERPGTKEHILEEGKASPDRELCVPSNALQFVPIQLFTPPPL